MRLILMDGTVFGGKSFGAARSAVGEVVFNTGMVGYVESLTDPSYAGQILVLTYPLVGNYGVPESEFFESSKVQVAGLVVSEYSLNYSHHSAKQSLSNWLKKSDVPAVTAIDTRALTKRLREYGVMLGQIITSGTLANKFTDPNEENLVARVSIGQKKIYEPSDATKPGKDSATIVAVDCGMKENILRSLLARGARVIRVPWNYDFTTENCDGIVISNGPGNPTMCAQTIVNIQRAMVMGKPILGICLGNQLLALAAGGSTYKLKYGHRSQNQPCINEETKRCYITSQNHGYAVEAKSLPAEWKIWFSNANDGSVEGIAHKSKPWRSVQFHPESSPGPIDTAWIIERFIDDVESKNI